MPDINVKINGDAKGFKQAAKETERSIAGVQKVGGEVTKAGSAISAMGSAAGQQMGKFGQVLSALTSGPVAMLTAGFGLALAAGLKLWDRLTLSAEEYAQKISGIANRAGTAYSGVMAEQRGDKSLFGRLKSLDTSNYEGLAEAAALIEFLQKKYGDMGLSIDSATKKVQGLDAAEQTLREKQTAARENALSVKYGTSMTSLKNEFAAAEKTSRGMDFGQAKKQMDALFSGAGGNLDVLENFAKTALDNAKTGDAIDAWNKILDKMKGVRDTQNELRRLRETGYGSDAEEAAALKEKADAAKAVADAEKKGQEATRKQIQDAAKSLLYKQMELAGRAREAAIEKALDQARANGPLSQEQEHAVAALAGLTYDANNLKSPRKIPGQPEIANPWATDSLIQMGERVNVVSTINYPQRTLTSVEQIKALSERISETLKSISDKEGSVFP